MSKRTFKDGLRSEMRSRRATNNDNNFHCIVFDLGSERP